jgi:hypothetical protein
MRKRESKTLQCKDFSDLAHEECAMNPADDGIFCGGCGRQRPAADFCSKKGCMEFRCEDCKKAGSRLRCVSKEHEESAKQIVSAVNLLMQHEVDRIDNFNRRLEEFITCAS